MKLYNYSFALLLGIGTLTACEDKLEVTNPNQQTTGTFGFTSSDLEECVIAAYNHIRMEGTYARVGYNIDVCRGDEVWNASQVWYMPFDDLNDPITDEIAQWSWRDWYYTINVCNYILSRTGEDNAQLTEKMRRIKEVEKDFSEAMTLLPSRDEGGEWSKGRATCGAAAGYYARALMMRHKYSEALDVLKDIIGKKYGTYKLMANYGDNFREGSAYENNAESLFEVQFLDYGTQGTDDEWTPVNTSPNATQGHAIESNFGPGAAGGWADLSASPWLYNLFLAEKTTEGKLDPRLYWTIGTYEADWEGFEFGNVCYTTPIDPKLPVVTNNNYGGLPIAKNTNLRTGLYDKVVTGLHCGINLRMMRYSDVLLRAAECENELNGPSDNAINWINQVRQRAGLKDLKKSDFDSKDKLFEQIANVERPKEFGCEFGRGFDLLRWGFFYDGNRLQQLKEHGAVKFWTQGEYEAGTYSYTVKDPVIFSDRSKSSFDTYVQGHEFLPIFQTTLNDNPNLRGNSANYSTSNSDYFTGKGWTVHPVVNLSK